MAALVEQERAKYHTGKGNYKHEPRAASIKAMATLLHDDGLVRMATVRMLAQVPSCRPFRLNSISDFLEHLEMIITHVPMFGPKPVSFPLTGLFVYMMWTPAGADLFRHPKFVNVLNHLQMVPSLLSLIVPCSNFSLIDRSIDSSLLHRALTHFLSGVVSFAGQQREFVCGEPHRRLVIGGSVKVAEAGTVQDRCR